MKSRLERIVARATMLGLTEALVRLERLPVTVAITEIRALKAVQKAIVDKPIHECGVSDDSCEDCCEHSDTDEHCCLQCGKDMSEEFASRAEAAADAARDR